jgi:hypothetical protein
VENKRRVYLAINCDTSFRNGISLISKKSSPRLKSMLINVKDEMVYE